MSKISIIIPLYNKAPYFKKALDSVRSQTYTDWECIIVDDGSTDGSADMAEQQIKCDKRFSVIHQQNAGVAMARNNGASASHGEYLCFLDADDWWNPKFLEKMLAFAVKYPNAGLWASNYIYYKPGKTRIGVCAESGLIDYPQLYRRNGAMPVWTGTVLMRRSVFEEMAGFPAGVRLGEDFLLWSRVAIKYPVAFLNEPLAYYNNDVPATLRATHNLHAPEHNMLFRMAEIERLALQSDIADDWKCLFDWLRVNGLKGYWLSDKYHGIAAEELKKVDWTRQSGKVVSWYRRPIWLLRAERWALHLGSYCKQKMMKIIRK